MKRTMLCFLSMLFIFSLCSCTQGNWRSKESVSDSEYSDRKLEMLVEIINEKDENELQKMFSQNAKEEVGYLNSDIQELLEFVDGEITDTEDIVNDGVVDELQDGKRSKWISAWYYLWTEKEKYLLFFQSCMIDENELDNVGLYTIQILKAEDEELLVENGGFTDDAGIYIEYFD